MLTHLQKASGFFVEKLSRAPLPKPISHWSVRGFAALFGIDMAEAELPIDEYKSIADLFTRRLRPGIRPLGDGIVHVADSVLTQCGPLIDSDMGPRLIQAKGVDYSLVDLVGDTDTANHYAGGTFFTYYLCPRDYHRVHQPWAGRLRRVHHIPGYLWPVNSLGVQYVPGLFARNERVVMEFDSPEGRFLVIMVAALNVGGIDLLISKDVGTNVEKGDELGVFQLGSSVVVVFDRQFFSPTLSRLIAALPKSVKVRSAL